MKLGEDNTITQKSKSDYDDYFNTTFHAYYSPLCNYALKVTGSFETAEDLVQDLFMQLYEMHTLFNISNPERFLIKCIKYRCIDYLRNTKKNRKLTLDVIADKAAQSSSEITEEEIEPLLHYFASKLPVKTREVFLLSRNSGMTYHEIAEELKISVKTVEAQMGRAFRHLRTMLKSNHLISLLLFYNFIVTGVRVLTCFYDFKVETKYFIHV